MKYLRPFLLTLICWISVWVVPATRAGLYSAWVNHHNSKDDVDLNVDTPPFKSVNEEGIDALRRFPKDKDVLIYVARTKSNGNAANLKILGKLYPRDPFVISLQVDDELAHLKGWRYPGPLSNPNYHEPPMAPDTKSFSPQARWDAIIALTRRGQQLDPNNTYFDWLLLHEYLSTNRDEEAKQVLKAAEHKTVYDSFYRAAAQNSIAYLDRVHGAPTSPIDLVNAFAVAGNFNTYSRSRQVARSTMEMVISDRHHGQSRPALDSALGLMKLSRVMRVHGYSLIESMVGEACEAISLSSADRPPVNPFRVGRSRFGSSLASYHSQPLSLYRFAKSTGRKDLLATFDGEWNDINMWRKTYGKMISLVDPYSMTEMLWLTAAEKMRSLCLTVIPAVLALAAFFGLLKLRFRERTEGGISFWRIFFATMLTLLSLTIFDLIIVIRGDVDDPFTGWPYGYYTGGLLTKTGSWAYIGLAGILFCLGISRTTHWQKQQQVPRVRFKERIKGLFQPPEDNLARFDFGWAFGIVAKLSFLLVWLGIMVAMAMNMTEDVQSYAWLVPALTVLFFVVWSFASWRRLPQRRIALALSCRLIFDAAAGALLILSVLYALIAFATLPNCFQFERDFQSGVQKGELQLGRERLGL